MGVFKWIAGGLGFAMGGPIGALIGYLVGSFFDGPSVVVNREGSDTGQRNGFLVSLLVLAAYIIRADKRIYKSEKIYVQNFLLQNFGQQAVDQGMPILEELLHKEMDVDAVCGQIADNLSYEQRMQLLAFLANIAKVDGRVAPEEVVALKRIAVSMRMSISEVDAVLNLGQDNVKSAYKVLEVQPTVSDDELRKVYKKLVLKYHPDRVATLGADVQKAAEENLKKVNSAYDTIRKSRGMT